MTGMKDSTRGARNHMNNNMVHAEEMAHTGTLQNPGTPKIAEQMRAEY